MLPRIDLCGLSVSRLILGGNPVSGFSHQSRERDTEMIDYYTVARIKETLARAEAASINTTVLRSDLHIHRLLREYYNEGGKIQWIAQVGADSGLDNMERSIDAAIASGAKAAYIHGGLTDELYAKKDERTLRAWLDRIRKHGVPAGVAGHAPEAHLWVDGLGAADFQVVCFYNCGSLHAGKGDKFDTADPPKAVAAIRRIKRPCIGYKILGAGRVEARKAFEYALSSIKSTDAVNVGMYRGDNDGMVEDNVALAESILSRISA